MPSPPHLEERQDPELPSDPDVGAKTPFRSGFCALLGKPNVGKSTLVNRLVGAKVAIVTPKPQTTRTRILGILQLEAAQVVLVDTPGLVEGQGPLARLLRKTASSASNDADVVVLVAEVGRGVPRLTSNDDAVLATARRSKHKVILALNKVDTLADKATLLPWMATYAEAHALHAIVPISARTGEGVDKLQGLLVEALPAGPPLFARDVHTDQAERFLAAEMVREQLLLRLRDEVPHSSHVAIEVFEDLRDDVARPRCHLEGRIVVERQGQKAIVIGDGGATIKAISTAARRSIESMLGCPIFLRLQVGVDAKWTQRPDGLRRYGLSTEGTSP